MVLFISLEHWFYQKKKSTNCFVVWNKPVWKKARQAIASLLTVAFIMPTMSWAFNTSIYEFEDQAQIIAPKDPASKNLAKDYKVPSYLGELVEAKAGNKDMTIVLIQDLHCNQEIQRNIQGMINSIVKTHKNLDMIAVEGETGIIPTASLGYLSDTPQKRAVADYFLAQGKLTGADYVAICDHPQIELFGSETKELYEKSLQIVKEFSTLSNIVTILDIKEILTNLENQTYNEKLLTFEKRRTSLMLGDFDIRQYHRELIKEAKELKVDIFPQSLRQKISQGKGIDAEDRILQDQYLEAQILKTLITNQKESDLLAKSRFIEIAQGIISISASHNELELFEQTSQQMTVTNIAGNLDEQTESYLDQEDLQILEAGLKQAIQFYEIAKLRDKELIQNTLARANQRKDKLVVLITGGFHTPQISKIVKDQSYNLITLKPKMTKIQTTTNYFDMLQNPDRPTELERIIAAIQAKTSALAVKNFITNVNFRNKFINAVNLLKRTKLNLNPKGVNMSRKINGLLSLSAKYTEVGIQTKGQQIKVLNKLATEQAVQNAPFLTKSKLIKSTVTVATTLGAILLFPFLSEGVIYILQLFVTNELVPTFLLFSSFLIYFSKFPPLQTVKVYDHHPAEITRVTDKIKTAVGLLASEVALFAAVNGLDISEIPVKSFKKATGIKPEEWRARVAELGTREAEKDIGNALGDDDVISNTGNYVETLTKRDFQNTLLKHYNIGLTELVGKGTKIPRLTFDRVLKDDDIKSLALIQIFHIDNKSRNGNIIRRIVTRIISVNPHKKLDAVRKVLAEFVPQAFKSHPAIQEFESHKWTSLFPENRDFELKDFVNKVLSHPPNEEYLNDIKNLNPDDQLKLSKESLRIALNHEIGHVIAFHLTNELFEKFGKLVDEEMIDIVNNLEGKYKEKSVGVNIMKNMIKARAAALRASQEQQVPSEMPIDKYIKYKFILEQFADKWALFIEKRNDNADNVWTKYGRRLTNAQEFFLNDFLDDILLAANAENRLMDFDYETLVKTIAYRITGVLAAAGLEEFDFFNYSNLLKEFSVNAGNILKFKESNKVNKIQVDEIDELDIGKMFDDDSDYIASKYDTNEGVGIMDGVNTGLIFSTANNSTSKPATTQTTQTSPR